jgi:DNA-binding NarL/FixJ family response regulator
VHVTSRFRTSLWTCRQGAEARAGYRAQTKRLLQPPVLASQLRRNGVNTRRKKLNRSLARPAIRCLAGSDLTANSRTLKNFKEASQARRTTVRIAVIDSNPLRLLGFCALLSSESDFDLQSLSLTEIGTHPEIDIVLLGSDRGRNVFEALTSLNRIRHGLGVIVTGCDLDDADILKAIAAGAKGYVDDASVGELARAIRIVWAGSVWAPRRVLAMFVEQACRYSRQAVSVNQRPFTDREKEVLGMLVAGCSNKEIAAPLGIEQRTVKAHIAKLMRKVGVANRVLLSVHAITHSLVPSRER